MRKWENAEIEILNLEHTNNQPTSKIAVDDLIDGIFVPGIREGSGPQTSIDYKPGNN